MTRLATELRQANRRDRRLLALSKLPREACPAKAQASAYTRARELERELEPSEAEREAAFFNSDDGDEAASSSPSTSTDATQRRRGILRRRRSETESRRRESSSPLSSSLPSRAEEEVDDSQDATTKSKPGHSVVFASNHATNIVTGEDVPANPSNLSWGKWMEKNQCENARAQLDAMRADAQGELSESDLDSEDAYVCSTDEENFWSDAEDDTQVAIGEDSEVEDDEGFDERLSGSGTTRNDDEQDSWSHGSADWDSDSESGEEYDADLESDEEEEGPEWEFY